MQRVTEASVTVDGEVVGAIGPGLCVLVGVTHADGPAQAAALADKVWNLRILDDAEGVEVVGVAKMSEGHALGSAEPWMTGYTAEMLMRGGAPFHPNAAGHKAVADELVRRVRGDGVL